MEERRFHQAPVSYRIIPGVLGQVHRAVVAVEKAAAVSLRSLTSDIVYISDEMGSPAGRAARSGGYHNGMVYPALNALSAAWADLALVAERQVTALNTAETSGLPVNLAVPGFPETAPTPTAGRRMATSRRRVPPPRRRCCRLSWMSRTLTCCRRRSAPTAGSAAQPNAWTACWLFSRSSPARRWT
jgi:Aromatic amino acid lyase